MKYKDPVTKQIGFHEMSQGLLVAVAHLCLRGGELIQFQVPIYVESVFPILKMGCLYEDRPFTMPNKNMLGHVYLITLQGTNTYPTWGRGKSSTQKSASGKGYVSSLKGKYVFPFLCDFHVSVVVLFQV